MAIAWTTVENALQTWLRLGSGLAGSKVIFGRQDGPKPARSFLTLRLGGIRPLGLDDSEELVVEGTPVAGAEIEVRAGGLREFSVTVEARTVTTLGTGAARAILSQVQAALALPSVMDALSDAGCSCFDAGQVLEVSTVLDAAHEGRALLECRFYANEYVSEFVGYIEHVQLVDYPRAGVNTVVP
jgi:hypothetical protein